jgi:hypothetical protein
MFVFPILMNACFWRQIRWLCKMQMLPEGGPVGAARGGRYADPEFAVITEKLWVDLASEGGSPRSGHTKCGGAGEGQIGTGTVPLHDAKSA